MNWLPIITALETYVAGLDVGLPIFPDNMKFNSTPGVPHIVMAHFPVDTSPLTVGRTGVMDTEGVLLLALTYPSGEGGGAAFSKADALAMAFMPGQSITAGSGNIVISKATLGTKQPSSKADWWVLPLAIHFNAYHNY